LSCANGRRSAGSLWPGPIPKLSLQGSNPKFGRPEWPFVPAGARRRDFLAERSQAARGPYGRALEPLKRKTVDGVHAGRFPAAAAAESMPYAKTGTTRSCSPENLTACSSQDEALVGCDTRSGPVTGARDRTSTPVQPAAGWLGGSRREPTAEEWKVSPRAACPN
jgi:hypothetical protein